MGEEIAKRLIDDLLMQLRISTNPHLEPAKAEEFLKDLLDRRRAIWGPMEHNDKFDKEAFDALKQTLQNESKSIKVK